MANFIKNFYANTYDIEIPINSGTLEQIANDMAINRYITACRERIDRHSFILDYNSDLYQVVFINEDIIVVQMVRQNKDNKYELINDTLRIMDLEEYGEFVQKTKR